MNNFDSNQNPAVSGVESIVRTQEEKVLHRVGAATGGDHGTLIWVLLAISLVGLLVALAVVRFQLVPMPENVVLGILGLFSALTLFSLTLAMIVGRRLYRERSMFREIFYGSKSGRMVTDMLQRPLMWNDSMEALVASAIDTPTDIIQKSDNPYTDFVQLLKSVPENLGRFDALADVALRGGQDSAEMAVRVGDDRILWFHVAAMAVPGWLGAVHWRIEDITETHTVNDAVYAERGKLIDFTDNAPVGFFSVDADGRFVFVNATLARWLGADIETLMVQGRLHTYLADVPEGIKPYDIQVGGGAKQYAEVRMKGPAGRLFLASISQSVVKSGDGSVRTRGVVHDLTAEREIRQALQESEARFQRLFDEAPLGIAMMDTSGRIRDCNPALAAMLQLPLRRIEGQVFLTLVTQEDQARVSEALSKLNEGKNLPIPLDITLTADGRTVAVQMHARGFANRGAIVLHFIDQTKARQLEAQFAQSQKMQAVGQLAGGVAHDFNNLLTAMIGFCDLLLLRHRAGDPSFSDIMQIKQNANRASNLVRQLLAFSRQQTLQPKVLDVTETLTELSHLLRRLIGVMIEMDLYHADSIGLVKVDEGQLEQVLINLVVNARDAMNGQGHLTIRTENLTTTEDSTRGADTMPAGHWVVISVTDTGCGISRENLARIWEPFFTTKEIGKGTGLGLATVYGITRQTGGYVHVESAVGRGTTFSIYLPRYEASAEETAKETVTAKALDESKSADLTGNATILLVEDEDAVRNFSSRALTNKGYRILEAINGVAAMEILSDSSQPRIDLIVTDVIMPEMDGPTFVRAARERLPKVPVIFVSGYAEDRFKEEFGEGTYFLPKPYSLQLLATKVKEVLSG